MEREVYEIPHLNVGLVINNGAQDENQKEPLSEFSSVFIGILDY